jgi:hypothetical protein
MLKASKSNLQMQLHNCTETQPPRPLMESPPRSEILVFDHLEGPKDKGARRYIWLEQFDYVLILQKKKRAFFWVTAFYIDSERKSS